MKTIVEHELYQALVEIRRRNYIPAIHEIAREAIEQAQVLWGMEDAPPVKVAEVPVHAVQGIRLNALREIRMLLSSRDRDLVWQVDELIREAGESDLERERRTR